MEAQFGAGVNPASAKVDLPQERREFLDFTIQGNRLRWTLARAQVRIRFDGVLNGDVIRGEAEQNGTLGEFQLVRINRMQPSREPLLAGTYRTRSAGLITVARFDFGDGVDRLALMDAQRGYWGMLLPGGPDAYIFSPARSGRFPLDMHVEFNRNADAIGSTLTMTGIGADRVPADRVDAYESRDVTFQNGEVRLAGTIVSPREPGTHPAVVMVHSSGNQSRNGPVAYFRLIANLLAANGITTLVYDKRGVGSSTGSWPTATFDDLAGDVRAAVAALRSAPGVDRDGVGLWSLSQGGWVAPLAASEDTKIAFLLLVSAAATTPAQQEIDRVSLLMKANQFSQTEIESAQRYLQTFFDVASNRRPWETLETAMAGTGSERWISYVPRPRTSRDVGWTPAPATLDPASIFARLKVPAFTIHGADDLDVPAATNSTQFAKISTHPQSRQQIFAHSDHYMLVGIENPDIHYRRLSSEYLSSTVEWIKQIAK
jgi:pimeloyl-ACP methyl ester carboxylesterase